MIQKTVVSGVSDIYVTACWTIHISVNFTMNRYFSLLFFLMFLNVNVVAQEPGKVTDEDRRLINETTRDYNICVQQNAVQQLDNFADIRKVAALAVNLCEHQLNELKVKLGSKANSDLYSGLGRHIKNRAIKTLLPLLMIAKSSRQARDSEN